MTMGIRIRAAGYFVISKIPPFDSNYLQAVRNAIGVNNIFNMAYNPKFNGQSKRINKKSRTHSGITLNNHQRYLYL